jgi:flagellar hook-associated protein 2
MAGLSAAGVGSGLDVNGLVSQLMAIERQPVTILDNKEASYQAKVSAYGALQSALSQFQGTMNSLSTSGTFKAAKATIADPTVAQVSASGSAQAGSYSIEVQALAQAQKLKSTTFANTTDSVGTGTLTIQFGTYSGGSFTANAAKSAQTITISSGSNSLAGVRDAINAANVGVTASILNDGTNNRLVLTSAVAGAANALKISVADDDGNNTDASGLSSLAYDASTGGATNLAQAVAAQDSLMVIDGISVSKPTNTVFDAIQGVTLNLSKTNIGSPTTLNVAKDNSAAISAAANFVNAWNSANSTLAGLGAYNATTKTGAVLQGDATLLSIRSRLRNLVNSPLSPAAGGVSTLSDAGISFQTDGTLKLDPVKLQTVLDDPAKDISALFGAVGKTSDSLISFSYATSAVPPGSYAVSVSQLATHGVATGNTAAGLTITAGGNDTLNLSVDGNAVSVTLGAGTYTAATLAAELQSRINGVSALSASGSAVTVSQSGGMLTITSNRYGSASKVDLNGGNASSGLFGTAASTAGLDVAGSIDGVTATGIGQVMTANNINLTVAGGATGSRGTLTFGRGFANQISTMLDGLVGSSGLLAGRLDGINTSIKDIGTQRDALNLRLVDIEKRYRAQFTALDTMMAQMNTTSSYLTQQLAAIAKNN